MSDSTMHAMQSVSVPSCPHCGTRPASYGKHTAETPDSKRAFESRTDIVELIWDCGNCGYHIVLSATSAERFNRSVEPVAAVA